MGDGYADANTAAISCSAKPTTARRRTEPTERYYTDGVVPGAQDAARQRQPLGRHIRNISAILTGTPTAAPTQYGIPWLTACSSSTWKRKRLHNRTRATPEEIALGRGAFLYMLDVLKPDFVIVWGD